MKIAVVNLFDPLPGEDAREARYATFCRALSEAGHTVTWYTSDFSHLFKERRDTRAIQTAAEKIGYHIVFAQGQAYRKNVCPGRLRNHRQVTRQLEHVWSHRADPGDVVLVSLPPPGLAEAAACWARGTGAKLVLDVQDLWPETFERFWPFGFGWLHGLVFGGMRRASHRSCQKADAVIGVAEGYVRHSDRWRRPDALTAVLHLGVDLAAFDRAVQPLEIISVQKSAGEKWIFVSGSLGAYVDQEVIVRLMDVLRQRGRNDVRMIIVGSGPAEAALRNRLRQKGLLDTSVRVMGRVSYETYASLAAASDIGLLPLKPEAHVFFPNRVFQYFAAGLPVLGTVGGELANVLAEHHAGRTVSPTDTAGLADAAEALLERPSFPTIPAQRRERWVDDYDRQNIAERLRVFLEEFS
ncbi:MAG: glycosyltransferase family 4 protein [Phycisphaerae bacterium]|nr:glycosyltransferase family 4 protein [Phycisphaerae bacterium]